MHPNDTTNGVPKPACAYGHHLDQSHFVKCLDGFCDHINYTFSTSLSSETKVFCFRSTLDLLHLKNSLVVFSPFGIQHVFSIIEFTPTKMKTPATSAVY